MRRRPLILTAVAVLLCATLFAQAVTAQDVVGTAIVNGKRVEILSDKSWRYDDEIAENDTCAFLHRNVSFCGSASLWKLSPPTGEFTKVFNRGENIYAGAIIEDIGTNDGVSRETLREIILSGAAEAAGVNMEEIPVIDVFERSIGDHTGEAIVYGARVNGINAVFVNTSIVLDNLTMQILVWTISKEFTPKLKQRDEEFISNVRITWEAPVQ